MVNDKSITIAVGLCILGLFTLLVLSERHTRYVRREGVCFEGYLYNVDQHLVPVSQRLDADGKPRKCPVETP